MTLGKQSHLSTTKSYFHSQMYQRLKILFVCTINRMRSATAHTVYRDDERFEVRSAETYPCAKTVLSLELAECGQTIL